MICGLTRTVELLRPKKQQLKHQKYDLSCYCAGWSFVALAMGSWEGVGPEWVARHNGSSKELYSGSGMLFEPLKLEFCSHPFELRDPARA